MTGALGHLTDDENARLDRVLRFVLAQVTIEKPTVVNSAADRQVFAIYTCDASAEAITQCTRGNAIYDADLDAVFVDISLLRIDVLQDTVKSSTWSSILSFHDVYLSLILLHELGHRHLHRRTGGAYDLPSNINRHSLEKEIEADDFAVKRFAAAKQTDFKNLFSRSNIQPAHLFGIDPSTVDAAELPMLNLAVSMRLMTRIVSAWDSPYSLYYSNNTHPLFLERADKIMKSALSTARSDAIRSELQLGIDDTKRLKESFDRGVIQVQLDAPIQDAVLSDNCLTLLDASGTMYATHLRDLKTGPVTIKPNVIASGSQKIRSEAIWGKASDVVVLDRRGNLWHREQSALVNGSSVMKPLVDTEFLSIWNVCFSEDNHIAAVRFETLKRGAGKSVGNISILNGAVTQATTRVDDVSSWVAETMHTDQLEIVLDSIQVDRLFCQVQAKNRLIAMVSLDLATLRELKAYPIVLDSNRSRDAPYSIVQVDYVGGEPRFSYVSTFAESLSGRIEHGVFLGRLHPDREMEPICKYPGLLRDFSLVERGGNKLDIGPYFKLTAHQIGGDAGSLLAVQEDSIYLLRSRPASVSRVFHPGWMRIRTEAGKSAFLFSAKDAKRGIIIRVTP